MMFMLKCDFDKDIGLIESGQNAKIGGTYPFATFGEIPGRITQMTTRVLMAAPIITYKNIFEKSEILNLMI